MPSNKKSQSRALTAAPKKRSYRIGSTEITPLNVYHVPDIHPDTFGPWMNEADKIAWLDEATGLPCIIRRARSGYLSGYVGIDPRHPLFALDHEAVPADLDIEVHGGLSYSEACDEEGDEATSVCHVHAPDVSELLWWFGFDCNQAYDLVPERGPNGYLGAENGPIYRDEAYVFQQCTNLAAQLHAIAAGEPKPDLKDPPPPIGLAPHKMRGRL